jgi:peptidoglycan hydrolase-like protein with peptidoglycan-binding domain
MANYWHMALSIKEVQRLLKLSGRYIGNIDDVFGSGTENAIKNFQQAYDLIKDGVWRRQC